MLESKRYRVEDVFRRTIENARLVQQREEERRRERERLERAEREAPAIVPVVQHLNRQVLPWALPLQQPARHKGASGGRGRGASHFFAEQAVEEMVENPSLRFACIREFQQSLKFSAKALVESKIRTLGVEHLFDVLTTEIRRRDHDGIMIFQGMQDHTATSIKSLEGFARAWVEEAQSITKKSLDMLIPTIRAPGSEIWYSWNPDQPTDAVDVLFATLQAQLEKGEITREEFVRVHATYLDNPLAPDVLRKEAERMRKSDPDAYEHIWMGGYDLGGHGRVYSKFKNKQYPEGNVDETIEDDETSELLVGMDFNVNPMSAVVGIRAVDELLILAALEIPVSNTEEMADELKILYPDRHIVVVPDPAGRQRRSSAPIGQTDLTILERAGFEVRAPSGPPPVVDRINNVNQMLLADGIRRLRIHPDAKALIAALASLTYKEGTSQPNKKSGFDHITDALGYLCWQEFNITTDVPQWGSSKTGLY